MYSSEWQHCLQVVHSIAVVQDAPLRAQRGGKTLSIVSLVLAFGCISELPHTVVTVCAFIMCKCVFYSIRIYIREENKPLSTYLRSMIYFAV